MSNIFTIREQQPCNNKYFIRKSNGGYNGAVLGRPCQEGADVLANCVGYANGRFNEILAEIKGKEVFLYQLTSDAGSFIKYGTRMGLKTSQTPQPGSIMVWDGGASGAGHVAVVEKVISKDKVYTSESNYGGTPFLNKTRTNANGRWGMNGTFKWLGFLLNPAVEEEVPKDTDTHQETSGTYTVVRGDTMTKIAKAHGITLGELKRLNPQVKNANLIYPGQILNVPKQEVTPPETLKVGDKVMMKKGAPVYGRNYPFNSWVYNVRLYVRAINGDRITVSTNQNGAVTGNVARQYIYKV